MIFNKYNQLSQYPNTLWGYPQYYRPCNPHFPQKPFVDTYHLAQWSPENLKDLPDEMRLMILLPLLKEIVEPILRSCNEKLAPRTPMRRFSPAGKVKSISYSPKGRIASASNNTQKEGIVEVWDLTLDTEKPIRTISAPTGYKMTSVSFDPGGELLACAARNKAANKGLIQIWNVSSDSVQPQHSYEFDGSVKSVSFGPNRKVAWGGKGIAYVWDLSTQPPAKYECRCFIYSVSFSPRTAQIALGTAGGVRIWNFETNEVDVLAEYQGPHASPQYYDVVFSSTGKQLAAVSGPYVNAGMIHTWDMVHKTYKQRSSTGKYTTNVAYSPDGSVIAVGGQDFIEIVNATTLGTLDKISVKKYEQMIKSLCYGKNGEELFVGSEKWSWGEENEGYIDLYLNYAEGLIQLYNTYLVNPDQMSLLIIIAKLYTEKPTEKIKLSKTATEMVGSLPTPLRDLVQKCFNIEVS